MFLQYVPYCGLKVNSLSEAYIWLLTVVFYTQDKPILENALQFLTIAY